MKTVVRLAAAGAFVFALGATGFAQAPAPAPAAPEAPAKPAAPKAPMSPEAMAKKKVMSAKAKECSAKADAQGLHGKARKEFREKCKAGKE
jgi:psiF repeat